MGPDYVHLQGRGVESNATITIQNNAAPATMRGVIVEANANGDWTADVWGHKGDTLFVEQEINGQRSPGISFVIR